MTKKEALQEFKEYLLPVVIQTYGKNDKPAMSQEWCNYIDSLHRNGFITSHQAETWDNPF